METSQIVATLRRNDKLRDRLEALVRLRQWSKPDAPVMKPLPDGLIDALAWACSASPAVLDTIKAEPSPNQIENGVDKVTDADLTAAITAAMPRLSDDPAQ